jgi:hypothetical protein
MNYKLVIFFVIGFTCSVYCQSLQEWEAKLARSNELSQELLMKIQSIRQQIKEKELSLEMGSAKPDHTSKMVEIKSEILNLQSEMKLLEQEYSASIYEIQAFEAEILNLLGQINGFDGTLWCTSKDKIVGYTSNKEKLVVQQKFIKHNCKKFGLDAVKYFRFNKDNVLVMGKYIFKNNNNFEDIDSSFNIVSQNLTDIIGEPTLSAETKPDDQQQSSIIRRNIWQTPYSYLDLKIESVNKKLKHSLEYTKSE